MLIKWVLKLHADINSRQHLSIPHIKLVPGACLNGKISFLIVNGCKPTNSTIIIWKTYRTNKLLCSKLTKKKTAASPRRRRLHFYRKINIVKLNSSTAAHSGQNCQKSGKNYLNVFFQPKIPNLNVILCRISKYIT